MAVGRHTWDEATLAGRAVDLALRPGPGQVAAAGLAAIAILGVLGVVQIVLAPGLGVIDLNGERNLPAVVTAAFLIGASLATLLVGTFLAAGSAWPWRGLSFLLLFFSADEFSELHERLEFRLGVDWQVLYLPVFAVAAVLWILVGRRLVALGAGFWLFLGGTASAVVSQVLESAEYGSGDRRVSYFEQLMVSEELLELLCALLIGLAMLVATRALVERPGRRIVASP